MIKRIIACLTICFIITGIISPVFSDASALPQPNWNDPGISEIINISDLTGWMLNGGTYDVSTYTDAESFMNDYYAARTKTRLEGSDYQVKSSFGLEQQYYQVGDSAYAHPLDVNRVISSSFRDHSGYGRRLSNEVNDALLSSGNLYDTKIPLLNEIEFANFVGYNHDALKLYSMFFNSSSDVDPDPDYSFISNINNIYTKDYSSNNIINFFTLSSFQNGNASRPLTVTGNLLSYSFCGDNLSSFHINSPAPPVELITAINQGIISIYLTTNNDDSVTASYSNINFISLKEFFNNSSYMQDNWFILRGNYVGTLNGVTYNVFNASYGNASYNYQQENFAGLSTAINYIYSHYANINLFVNGVPWNYAGYNPHITPEFPDAVGGEDLSTTTWPIFRPRAPYYTNVPGVLQAIEDAIADDGELDIDDLKPYLTDENGDPVPDPIFDPEPVPIPVPDPVNPDVVPGLPVLPAIPTDMPGFNGVSVLAEIINFTNQSLPTSLIVTFWGIVFGIVILGLIKILHK